MREATGRFLRASLVGVLCVGVQASRSLAVVFINEVNHNPAGSFDDIREYIELCGTPGKKLDGYAIAFLNGTEQKYYPRNTVPPNPAPEIDEFFSLDGLQLGRNGLLVLAIGAKVDFPETLADTSFFEFWLDAPPDEMWNGGLDVPGKLNNDGSNTMLLIRNRPGRTQANPTNPAGLRWGKDVFHDFDVVRNVVDPQTNMLMDQFGDGSIDQGLFNGLSGNNLDLRGSKTPETIADDLEVVDELSYEHTRGWEYDLDDRMVDIGSNLPGLSERRVHALGDAQGFNPDALTRVDYRTKGSGWLPTAGSSGELPSGRNWQDTATEQWIRGETVIEFDAFGLSLYYDNTDNIGTGSIQPHLTNVPKWLADGEGADYSFNGSTYRIMAGRVNPLAVSFNPGDVDRDGDCDADDLAKMVAVFGRDNWVFSNSFAAAPEGDSGDPAAQTRPWDVDGTGDNGIESSDLQWVLNFQGDTTGRIVGVRYDSTNPSPVGVNLDSNAAVQGAVTLSTPVSCGQTLNQLHVGETFDLIVSGRVASGARNAPQGQANGIMQFVHDLEIAAPGIVRAEQIEAIGPFALTRSNIISYQGSSGDRGVRTVNGYTTSFQAGLAGATPLYRIRVRAIGIGSTSLLVRPATAAKFASSTPHGLKVGHTDHNGDPAGSQYPAALAVSVTAAAPILGNCDGSPCIDLVDYGCFADCMNGPDVARSPGCVLFDLNADGRIDLRDFDAFEAVFAAD